MMRRKGDIAEIRATLWLLDQGYEVFRNVSGVGPVDIVVIDRAGKAYYVDVKSVTHTPPRAKGQRYKVYNPITRDQKAMGVRCLYVDEDWIGWAEEKRHRP